VKASGLSIREIEKQTGTRRSTLDGWKNGKSLPQELDALLKVVRALEAATGPGVDRQLSERRWRALLGEAKQARDDRASRRTPGGVNRNRELAAERRARSIGATTAAIEALGGLRDLEVKPDWTQERDSYVGKQRRPLPPDEQALVDGWEARRNGLIGTVQNAILDIEDPDLRARLKQAVQVLELWDEPMRHARQSESRTRFLATADALEVLGTYRRGDPAPDRDAAYRDTIGYVDLYFEELEASNKW
jgi:transcriptional regulator with XRE-family HTH domain